MAETVATFNLVTAVMGCLKETFDGIGNCFGRGNTADSTPEGNCNNQSTRYGDATAINHRLSAKKIEYNCCNCLSNWGQQKIPPADDNIEEGNTTKSQPVVFRPTPEGNINNQSAAPQAPAAPQASGHGSTSSGAPSAEMNATTGVITVGLWGHPNVGVPFEHKGYDGIKKMNIRWGSVIKSIDIEYRKPQGGEISKQIGRPGRRSERGEIIFQDGEYINKVIGTYGTCRGYKTINSLQFFTNTSGELRRYGKIMEKDGRTSTTSFMVEGGRIVGFYGKTEKYISAIGFYIRPEDCNV